MRHRLAIMFTLLAIGVVCLGALGGVRMGAAGVDIAWNHSTLIFSRIRPWHFVGAWFGVCALLYAFAMVRRSGRLALWHFWLSASGAATSLLGLATMRFVFMRPGAEPDSTSKLLIASMVAFSLAGPAIIVIGQMFLVAGIIQRFRRHPSPALA